MKKPRTEVQGFAFRDEFQFSLFRLADGNLQRTDALDAALDAISGPDPETLIGVEQELDVFSGRSKLDFRTVFPEVVGRRAWCVVDGRLGRFSGWRRRQL